MLFLTQWTQAAPLRLSSCLPGSLPPSFFPCRFRPLAVGAVCQFLAGNTSRRKLLRRPEIKVQMQESAKMCSHLLFTLL